MDYIPGFEQYKPLRNKFRKFEKNSLLKQLLLPLDHISSLSPHEWKGHTPWELLLFLKWLIADWENMKSNHEANLSQFNSLVNDVKNFVEDSDTILRGNHPQRGTKFLRKMAFQQFWLQEKTGSREIGMSIDLFSKLRNKFDVDSFLLNKIGLTSQEFIDLGVVTWSFAHKLGVHNQILNIDYFKPLKTFSEQKIKNFLDFLSIDLLEGPNFCKEHTRKDYTRQAYEQSPFKIKPLLKINQNYKVICPTLIDELLKNGLYDTCKILGGEEFTQNFGKVFEDFLRKSLDHYKIKYFHETWLKKNTDFAKYIDFLIPCENGNILLESKGIEAGPQVRENPTDLILASSLKDSIVKGINQAGYVNDKILNGFKNLKPNNFILVVTYKNLYLGDGVEVWEEFLKGKLIEKYGTNINNLDPKKIFFLSVDDFNKFLYCFNGNSNQMINKLEEILILKEKPTEKKFIFSQYLEAELSTKGDPHFLDKNFKELFNRLMENFKNTPTGKTEQF
jgi:hypothetical protein